MKMTKTLLLTVGLIVVLAVMGCSKSDSNDINTSDGTSGHNITTVELKDNDESFEKIEEITVEDLYSSVSENGKEEKELSRTADAYMYYHKTSEYVVAIDVYNTGYLDVSVRYNKQNSPIEHMIDLSEKNFEEYKDLRWSELEKSDVEKMIERFEKIESDYLQGKIILEESEK